MRFLRVVVYFLLVLPADFVGAGVIYSDPPGGWTYLYDGVGTNGLGACKPSVCLDGTWNGNNGSSEWDGSARGAGNGLPGGISSVNGILTIEDQDISTGGACNNRKIYFEHAMAQDAGVVDASTIVDTGITISFRARLTQPDIQPPAEIPLPDGWGIFSGGKGHFGVHELNAGAHRGIAFSLVRANEPVNNFQFAAPGLTFNRNVQDTPGGAVDSQANNVAANPIFPIDPNQFHEFWITIRTNDATPGNGTHVVTIYVDGSLAGTPFDVTAGDGNDGEAGANGNFIAMGLNNSVGSGCVDIDFFAYKQGLILPQPSRDTNSPPFIDTLMPTNNAAFYPAADGLTFTTSTLSPNSIAPANIHLMLNGTDVTGNLVISGSPTSRTANYSGLVPNRFYTARIAVADQAGRSETNIFQFNTLVTGNVVVLEAENYNYDDGADPCDTPLPRFFDGVGGSSLDNPILGLVPPSGYFHAVGLSNIDYFVPVDGNADVYRCSIDGTLQVGTRLSFDVARAEYVSAMFPEYDVTQMRSGQWMNYTHTYALSNYNVYLRGAGAAQQVRLDKVTSNPGVANQTTVPLGTFKVAATGSAYVDVPLTDSSGSNALVRLSGAQTLRLTALGANNDLHLNYLVLAPSSVIRPASVTGISPPPGATGVYPDAVISITLLNADTTVNLNSIMLFMNGGNVTAGARITPNGDATTITYDPPGFLATNTTYSFELVFADSAAHSFTNTWTLTTLPAIAVLQGCYAGSVGGDPGFNVTVRKAPNTAPVASFPNSITRAEQHLADLLLDPTSGQRFINEAAGPGGNGEFIETGVINYEQGGLNAGFFDSASGDPDAAFPGIPAGTPDFISMAVTTYLQFPAAGVYRFGVRSDDNFRLTAGVVPSDTNLRLGEFDVPGGRADAPTEFDFLVEGPGLYAMRLVYEEGQGGASLEWYSVDRTTGARTLINDAAATAIKAYQNRTIEPPCAPPLFTSLQPADNQFSYDATSGIIFSVVPSPGNIIPAENVHMTLNGTDVTAGLMISGGDEERAVFFNGLTPNRAYTAVVVVGDGQGRSSTMTVRFDTFVPDDVTIIEAEDYNYADNVCPPTFPAGGAFIDNPAIGAYAGLAGLSGVDFSDKSTTPTASGNVYRPCDPVGTDVTLDAFRPPYVTAGANDFQVWQLQSGEWLNYTRTFDAGCYDVYLRVSSSTARRLRLDRVDGDPTSTDQTPYAQGLFLVPNTGGPTFYQYVRLTDALGQPATVSLAGAQTLRLTAVDANSDVQPNFLVLTAAGTPGPPLVASASPAPGAMDVPINAAVDIVIGNGCSRYREGSASLQFDGVVVTSDATITSSAFGATIHYVPKNLLAIGSVHTVSVAFQDNAMPPNLISKQWGFTVVSRVLEAPVYINFQLSGAPIPTGYLPDYGDVFADRGNGFSYGWDGDNRNTARYRQSANSPDLRHDTLEHLQKPPPDGPHFWEIALPNGQYVVHSVAGDPDNSDSAFQYDIEGTLTAPYTPSAAAGLERWVEYTNTVTVNDGRLTINSGPSAANNKICYVDITPALLALAPVIVDTRYGNGTFTFSFDTKPDVTYVIEYKNTLDDPMEAWHFLQNAAGTGMRVTINDMTGPVRSRFYRMRLQ